MCLGLETESDSEKESVLDSFYEQNIHFLTPEVYNEKCIIKFSNIVVHGYTLSNLIFRTNLILTKTNVANRFVQDKFLWDCYLFVKGRHCKFTVKIYKYGNSGYLIDIDKIDNSGFIFREWADQFKLYFANILEINSQTNANKLIDDNFECQFSSPMLHICIYHLNEFSSFRSKDETLNCIDLILEILEDKRSHQYAINSGIHFRLCYLLMELEFDQDQMYSTIDTILYILFLLSTSTRGQNCLKKCMSLVDFLNRITHNDLMYYQLYTFELAQAILRNII